MNQGILPLLLSCLFVAVVVIQAKPKSCKDKLPNCKQLMWESCKGKYKPWALKNCKLTCGLCDEDENQALECKDYHANCDYYAINKDYHCSRSFNGNMWAEVNCRKYCGLCDPDKPFDNNSTSSGGKSCEFRGGVYEVGMRWYSGCWSCNCNKDRGWECVDVKCRKFDLPKASCFWKPNPNKRKCCDIPVCPDGTSIKYPYWYIDN